MAYQQQPPPYNPGYGQQPAYPPPQPYYHATPGYQPAPPPQASNNNNIVVVTQQPTQQRVYVEDNRPNHLLHFIITLLCWPWIFVWICLCIINGC